jgi:TrmH RNA methyltransferase
MKKNKPFSAHRKTSDSRPQGRGQGRPEGTRDRPLSPGRDRPNSSRPQKRSEGPRDRPFSHGRERPNSRPQQKTEESAAKPFVVYRKNPDDPQELKYYGFHACLKLWESRPEDVIRVYVDKNIVKDVGELLKWCASKALAYHVISEEEMAKVSDSVHHEGLCILAKEPKNLTFAEMIEELKANQNPACLMYLDGVQNPHNIGSIMRVAAHFGIKYILGQKATLPKVSPSAYRVAQGGAEHVKIIAIDDTKRSFKELENAGFKTVASSNHGGHSLYNYKFNPRTVIVMGSESEGVHSKLLESAHETLLIPGSGNVESLNVSVATGLFLGEYYRQVESKKYG